MLIMNAAAVSINVDARSSSMHCRLERIDMGLDSLNLILNNPLNLAMGQSIARMETAWWNCNFPINGNLKKLSGIGGWTI